MKKLTVLTLIAAALLFTACGESASNPSSNGNTQNPSSNGNTETRDRPNGQADDFGSSKDAAALDRAVNGKCGISKCGASSHPIPEDN